MLCPHCRKAIPAEYAARSLGSVGGSVKGKTKARAVDYAQLARLSHQRRAENKAKK